MVWTRAKVYSKSDLSIKPELLKGDSTIQLNDCSDPGDRNARAKGYSLVLTGITPAHFAVRRQVIPGRINLSEGLLIIHFLNPIMLMKCCVKEICQKILRLYSY